MENDYLKIVGQVQKYGTAESVMHLINERSLYIQHKRQLANKAVGIDGVNKFEYHKNVKENLANLVAKMKTFSYRPLPVKRVFIPKAGSDKKRPLGIPTYEDKLVQGAMAEVLNVIYEQKFLDCSYGFREARSCHDAIKALDKAIVKGKTNWIVDADIKGFFDNVNHAWLIKFLEHDIKDKNFIRYIKRFLIGGIMDKGHFVESDKGTPQGGVISPILANVYLHYVLDLWFEKAIKPACSGFVELVRYADDFVVCFEFEHEARGFYRLLEERLEKFGLELSKEKSKIIKFGRNSDDGKGGNTNTFDFLGFTHINGKTRKGSYKLQHITAKAKLKAKRQAVKQWLKANMHTDKCKLVKQINIKLLGHYRYYGITNNYRALDKFRYYVSKILYFFLKRRSQRKLKFTQFLNFLKYNPLAQPKIFVPLGNY